MAGLSWQFEKNEARRHEGQHSGIAHFAGKRRIGIVRETIQNSLDAWADRNQPVFVDFRLINLPKMSFSAIELGQSIQCAIASPAIDEQHRKLFQRGLSFLQEPSDFVPCLVISDSNTTGASYNKNSDLGKPTPFEALMGSGISIKSSQDAAGSYGFGKFAPFACTPLRTVLYSTSFIDSGTIQRCFQGKVILVTHHDKDERPLKAI